MASTFIVTLFTGIRRKPDIGDIAHLIIFVLSENFEFTKKLLPMETMKDTTTEKIFSNV